MRKYVINFKRSAYEQKQIDYDTYMGSVGCMGLRELKATLGNIDHSTIDSIDTLTSDSNNAYIIGDKNNLIKGRII